LQLLYDSHRSLLYALTATKVDVLNPATLQWESPIVLPQPATPVSYATMALSPDGSWLVIGSSDSHIVVLDPDQPAQAQLLTSSLITFLKSMTITEFDKVILSGSQVVELDLSSLNFTALHIVAGGLVRASADGTHVYGIDPSADFKVYSIDPSSYTVQKDDFGYTANGWTDIAVSADGSQFAAVLGPPFATGDYEAFFNPNAQYLNTNVYPDFSPPDDTSVIGATFSPAGKVLVVPLGDSIEFWNAAQGTLLSRLMTPEELHVWAYPEVAVSPLLALDSTGEIIYAVSSSGLTVLTLPEPLDQLPGRQWPSAYTSGGTRSGLQGSLASRMRAMQKRPEK
jgi:WD40 repeat protein